MEYGRASVSLTSLQEVFRFCRTFFLDVFPDFARIEFSHPQVKTSIGPPTPSNPDTVSDDPRNLSFAMIFFLRRFSAPLADYIRPPFFHLPWQRILYPLCY